MAGSVNKVIVLGNLGKDPEIKTTQSGQRVANIRIATSEVWRDKASGERQERTEWHSVVVMNDALVDVVDRFLRRGSKVYVEGKLQTRKWTDKAGVEKYSTEIMLGRFDAKLVLLSDGEGRGASAERAPAGGGGSRPAAGGSDLDDEIPF